MRVTEDQVRRALQHPDKQVRFAAVQYFAQSYSRNPAIMPDVIELVERFGPKNAFAYSFPIADLAQTEDTIAWAVKRLQQDPRAEADFTAHVGRLLCQADPMLVLPHKSAILSTPNLGRELASALERRLGLISTPSDQLWQRLEEICEAGKDKLHADEIPIAEAEDIAEALARDESQCDRMMELLQQEVDPSNESSLIWLEIFLVQMAGHMRYEPAIPLIIKKLLVDGDLLNEACDRALTRIGTDTVVRAVRDVYPQAPEHFRLYSSGIFGDIHSDLALASGLELLSWEQDFHLKAWLAAALVDQMATEAIDAACTVLAEDPDSSDLMSSVVVACRMMAYDVPGLQQWERELAERRRPSISRGLSPPAFNRLDFASDVAPVSTRVKTGRNDPCPCGSGKKFKKCCWNKLRAQPPESG
jgi:SEC-C motif